MKSVSISLIGGNGETPKSYIGKTLAIFRQPAFLGAVRQAEGYAKFDSFGNSEYYVGICFSHKV
jgi:hypothetical protein